MFDHLTPTQLGQFYGNLISIAIWGIVAAYVVIRIRQISNKFSDKLAKKIAEEQNKK